MRRQQSLPGVDLDTLLHTNRHHRLSNTMSSTNPECTCETPAGSEHSRDCPVYRLMDKQSNQEVIEAYTLIANILSSLSIEQRKRVIGGLCVLFDIKLFHD